jgi:hypothetical protein
MPRSRLIVLVSGSVVGLGLLAALGFFLMDPARAAVGPLPGSGVWLAAETRYVMGLDAQRFVQSGFFKRFAPKGARPASFAELERKTGLDPERDVQHIIVAGQGKDDSVALVLGAFDREKLGLIMSSPTLGSSTATVEGVTLYLFSGGNEQDQSPGVKARAAAFLDDTTLALGSRPAIESLLGRRARREPGLTRESTLGKLLVRVKPGSTFWMVGDPSLLSNLPQALPMPGGGSQDSITIPGLQGLVVTGDVEPQLALDIVADTKDEAAAKNLADMARGLLALASMQASQRPELKQITSAISVTTDQRSVRIGARFAYEVLDALRPPAAAEAPPAAPPAAPPVPEAPGTR